MSTHTTAWITGFIATVLVVMGARYYDYVIKEDYLLEVHTNCDSTSEACFVVDCDNEDPDCDLTPYKKVEIVAHVAPKCLEEHTCEAFSCEGLGECYLTYCSDEVLEDGEKCSNLSELNNENVATNTAKVLDSE
jgi:hypothetical protein